MGIIKELPVWLPDVPTQTQILSKLDTLAMNVRAIEDAYEQKLATLAELKQSILQKAFAGELTSGGLQTLPDAAE